MSFSQHIPTGSRTISSPSHRSKCVTMTDIVGPPSILDHNLNQFFPELLKFESTAEMEASPLWKRIRPEVDRIINSVGAERSSEPTAEASESIHALAWNLERGIRLDGI